MLQALAKKGRVIPAEIPAPVVSPGALLIKVIDSCISAGTELTTVSGSGKSLVRRALDQPAAVARLLNMARSEGIAKAVTKVQGKLGAGAPIGYSVAGVVLAVGEGVSDIRPGDRVAAAGAGLANHAEYVDVPRNLVVPLPDGVDFGPASTVALGGIAMQGVRRASPTLGEVAVVFGVGIVGQLAAQLLRAAGARVIAVDLDERRLELAARLGCEMTLNPANEDAVKAVLHLTGGHGADIVLFCAATSRSETLSEAFAMTRRKGRLVMVGVWGAELQRNDIYAKEIDFLISTSYGPGRYDAGYEEKGLDYPYAYVRWTENRNMEEYLRLLAAKRVDVESLVEAVHPISDVEQAFERLRSPDRPLIVLLSYGDELPDAFRPLQRDQVRTPLVETGAPRSANGVVRVGLVGAGSFATSMHLPHLKSLEQFTVRAICDKSGTRAKAVAQQFGAAYATTDYEQVVGDDEVDLVMICTRHNLHGPMVVEALRAGKHTFVEKPLCLRASELAEIEKFYRGAEGRAGGGHMSPLLTVGYNRRFAPCIREIKKHLVKRINPLVLHYRMNAGYVPLDHWVHDPEQGGGRIIGEGCHILDLFSFLVGAPVRAYASASVTPTTTSVSASDNKAVTIEYEDGSIGTIHYFAVGPKALPKERLEVYWDEKAIAMEDYAAPSGTNVPLAGTKSREGDKGHLEELRALARALGDSVSAWPVPLDSLLESTRIAMDVQGTAPHRREVTTGDQGITQSG
jgi:predicted dehydrogenase/threonine dehydrogenase-like Zn-dependent dehydrogenase